PCPLAADRDARPVVLLGCSPALSHVLSGADVWTPRLRCRPELRRASRWQVVPAVLLARQLLVDVVSAKTPGLYSARHADCGTDEARSPLDRWGGDNEANGARGRCARYAVEARSLARWAPVPSRSRKQSEWRTFG